MTSINPRILLIEDEPPIRRFLHATLSSQGYELLESANGSEGLGMTAAHNPDVILLDLGLPDMDGLDVLRTIREWSRVPVIIVSVREQEREKVAGLDAGADDYLTKPFGVGELLARIRAALRRSPHGAPESTSEEISFGAIRIAPDKRLVYRSGESVHLTPIEYKLLMIMVRHRGKVITHKQLLHEIWGPSRENQIHYLRIYILRLRKKLEEDPNRPRWITSEPGMGYRLRDEET